MKNQARKMKKGIKSIRKRTHSRDRPDDEEGISEVVGSILTLTITVVIFTSVFASVTQLEGPEEQPHVDFSTEYEYTAQADYINITHEGGKNLDLDDHSFIVVVDDTGGEDSRSYSIDDDEMTTTGDESSFIIGDEICIKIEDELDISPDSRMELMVRQDSNSQIIYRTILLEEDRELLDIRNARIEYKFIWREHAEPGEEISIKAEVLAPIYLRQDDFRPEELNVTASTLQDGILYHEEKEEEVKEVELEHYHKGEFRSENISVVDDVDHTSYSVKINAVHEAEGLEATPEYISLHVGKPAVRRYQADLVIGNIDYEPGSPSHNEEFRVKIQIFNRGAQNYTADWKLKDNDVLKHEDTTTFIKGPDPTVVTAEYDIMGVDYHKIEVSVNTSFEDEDGSTVEDANPENNRKTFDVYVDPNMLIVKDMTADDDHEDGLMENALTDLDFDYGVHSVESEDEYPESDHLNQYSICIWVTGSGTDDEDIAPLPPSAQDELIKFIEEDNGRLWLLGSNLNEVDFQNDFRALLGISSGIGDTDETTLHGELENPEDDEDGTYGDHTYPVYSDTTAHELSLKSGVEDENTLQHDQGNNEIVGVGYDSDTDENKRTALNSFLFESVSHPAARGNMAQEVIKWLSNLTVRTGTDVSVSSQMIEPTAPMFMDNVTINATLRNNGAEDVNVTVRALRNQGEEVLEPVLDEPWLHIPGRGGTANVEFFWEADELGTHEFLVVADYYNELDENTRENNDITYKNLEITEDVVEVNVQYSTLVVDADVSEDTNVDYENVTKHVTDSLDRLGQERGETYDYYYVEDPANDNGPTASYMRNYNAIIWVTGERGSDVGQDIVFTEEDAERLLDYFEVEERGNVIFIGENILSYLYDNDEIDPNDAQALIEYMGVDPSSIEDDDASPTHIIGENDSQLGRNLRYRLSGASDIDTFDDTSSNGDVLFTDGVDNLASVYDDGSIRNVYMGINPNRFQGPLLTGEDFETWPGGDVNLSYENVRDEFFYTNLWYLGMNDERADLRVVDYDIEVSTDHPETGRSYEVTVEIENFGYKGASTMVRVKEGDDHIGTRTVFVEGSRRDSPDSSSYFNVEPGSVTVEFTWDPMFAGNRPLRVKIDPLRLVDEIEPYGEEGTEDKIMEFDNQAVVTNPVHYFYDDMERGPGKWEHDATLMNIDGLSPLNFIGRRDLNTNVEGEWDWDMSGTTSVREEGELGKGAGVYETDDPAVHNFTNNASHTPPRSFWLPESEGDPEMRGRQPLDIVMVFDRGIESEQDYNDAVDAAEALIDFLKIDDGDDRVAIYSSQGAAINDDLTLEQSEGMSEDDIKDKIPDWKKHNPQKAILDSTSIAIEELDDVDDERANKSTSGIITFTDGLSTQDQGEKYTPAKGQGGEPNQRGPAQWYHRDADDEKGLLGIPYNIMTLTISDKVEGRHHWISAASDANVSYGILERETEKLKALYKMFVMDLIQSERGELRSIPKEELDTRNSKMTSGDSLLNNPPVIENTEFFVYTDAFTTGHLDDEVDYYDWKGGKRIPAYSDYDKLEFDIVTGKGKVGTGTDNWVWAESDTAGEKIANTVYPRDTLDELEGDYGVKGAYAKMYVETDGSSLELRINDNLVETDITGNGEYINIPLDFISNPEPFDFVIEHKDGGDVILDDLSFTYDIDYIPEGEYGQEIGTDNKYRFLTTPSVDIGSIEDLRDAELEFQNKYWLEEGTTGGFIYLWGKNENENWDWAQENRLYVEPQQSYTGNLNLERVEEESDEGGLGITDLDGEPGDGLRDAKGELPQWVFNGKSQDGTFDWRHISVDVGQYDEFIEDHDEIRAVFTLAQFGGVTKEDGWESKKGWYLDNIRFKVSSGWSSDGPGYWNLTSASQLNEMGISINEDDENYHDHTHGDEDGHYWMFTAEEGGEDRLPQGIDSSLYTRPIYLDTADQPVLTAHMKFNIDDGSGLPPDGLRVEVSDDDGKTWDSITYGVRSGWGASGDSANGEYSGESEDGGYGWVESDSLVRLQSDLSGWRGERIILRFRVFTNTTEKYSDDNLPKAIFIDDVWITEGGLAMDQEPHSLEFDGDDDYVDLETDFYDPQTFSWAFWVNPDELDEDGDNNYRRIITSSDSAANIILIEENGDVSFRVPGVETDNFKAGNVPLNDWAHVVCVYDQSDRIIYVNGNEDDRENIGSGTVDFPPIQLVHPGSQTFDGNIDDVRLYDRALTPSEISGLFGGQDIMDGLVGWWPMDEGEGDLAYDYSGNRNHGTIYGASWSTDTPFAYLPTGGSEAEISWSEGSDLAPFDIEPVDIDEKPMAIDSQIVPPTKETDRDN